MNAEDELRAISAEVRACKACKLHLSRKQAVPGEGPTGADYMFIGEGPGFHENEQGRPFVGAAGKFLEELLASIGLSRDKVFIGNVVKCRPPGNRDPLPEEIQSCSGFLDRQIEAIHPKVIVTLGRYSMARFFPNARISDIHGQGRTVNGRLVVAMYHPAAALHQPALRRDIEADFANLPSLVARVQKQPPTSDAPASPDSAQQLSLF